MSRREALDLTILTFVTPPAVPAGGVCGRSPGMGSHGYAVSSSRCERDEAGW